MPKEVIDIPKTNKGELNLFEVRPLGNGSIVMFHDVGFGRNHPIITTLYPLTD